MKAALNEHTLQYSQVFLNAMREEVEASAEEEEEDKEEEVNLQLLSPPPH